jgi:hypothetical protein
MGVYVKNGTPLHGPSLCVSCIYGMVVNGYRESQEIVVCQANRPALRMTFPVRKCSEYVDRTRENLYEMRKIAWTIAERGPKRAAGFVRPPSVSDDAQIEIVLDAAQRD